YVPASPRVVLFRLCGLRRSRQSALLPYTTLFRSILWAVVPKREIDMIDHRDLRPQVDRQAVGLAVFRSDVGHVTRLAAEDGGRRSEEHTSELQSRENLVCRLLLEKKKRRETVVLW